MKVDTTGPTCYTNLENIEGGYSCLGYWCARVAASRSRQSELIVSGVMRVGSFKRRLAATSTKIVPRGLVRIVASLYSEELYAAVNATTTHGVSISCEKPILSGRAGSQRLMGTCTLGDHVQLGRRVIHIGQNIFSYGNGQTGSLSLRVGLFITSMVSKMTIALKISWGCLVENITSTLSRLLRHTKPASGNWSVYWLIRPNNRIRLHTPKAGSKGSALLYIC